MIELMALGGLALTNMGFMLRVEHRITRLEDLVKLCTACKHLEVQR